LGTESGSVGGPPQGPWIALLETLQNMVAAASAAHERFADPSTSSEARFAAMVAVDNVVRAYGPVSSDIVLFGSVQPPTSDGRLRGWPSANTFRSNPEGRVEIALELLAAAAAHARDVISDSASTADARLEALFDVDDVVIQYGTVSIESYDEGQRLLQVRQGG